MRMASKMATDLYLLYRLNIPVSPLLPLFPPVNLGQDLIRYRKNELLGHPLKPLEKA